MSIANFILLTFLFRSITGAYPASVFVVIPVNDVRYLSQRRRSAWRGLVPPLPLAVSARRLGEFTKGSLDVGKLGLL
jgi:hypothetical protein